MALAFTMAGLQAQLQVVSDAITSRDWPLAEAELANAELILGGMPEEVMSAENRVRLRASLDGVAKRLTAARASGNNTDRRRMIRTGLKHE